MLSTIRSALGTQIGADPAFSDFTVYGFEPKNPRRPSVVVGWPDVYDPRGDFAGNVDMVVPIRFEIVWRSDEQVDDELMAAMDAAVAAIESDRTLSGNVDDLSCGPFDSIGARSMPDDTVVATFSVPVEIMF